MAQTQGDQTFGAKVFLGDSASPPVFTQILEVFNVGPVVTTQSDVDFTHHESPDGFEEVKPGAIKRGSAFTVQANYVEGEATHDLIRDEYETSAVSTYRVQMKTGGTRTFLGYVSRLADPADQPVEGRIVFEFDIRQAGKVVRA